MTTVNQGAELVLDLGANDAYRITVADGGDAYVDLVSGAPGSPTSSPRLRAPTTSRVFGPYGVSARIRVRSIAGTTDVATFKPSSPVVTNTETGAPEDLKGSPVSGAGNSGVPTDRLVAPLQRVTITGALSTALTQTATATGNYYKARVVWNNNGASASAKLRIAVNADNAVHGLVVGQSAKRRDYEMTMGDGVILACGVPITSLTFSSDVSITGGTHQLQVTFGN